HRDQVGTTGAHCLMVEVPEHWVRRMRVGGLALTTPSPSYGSGNLLARIRQELTFPDELSHIVVEGLIMELACEGHRAKTVARHAPVWLRRVRDRIADEFATMPSMSALANEAGVHPAHLARAFRQHFGCTAGEFCREKRIEYCCRLLQTGGQLCEIAAAAGFA